MIKEKIIPYQSCSKSLFVFIGIILVLWSLMFSLILISIGAWPITIFLGAEYFLLVYLIRIYFKNINIAENITIDTNEIKIEKFKKNKIFKTINFNTYWSKISFYKYKNKSSLTIKQSSKQEEIAKFLHADLKEKLYYKIKNIIKNKTQKYLLSYFTRSAILKRPFFFLDTNIAASIAPLTNIDLLFAL